MNDLISVIVPVYKVEKYLDRCVESIVNQTYKNLEIILVDDGSPDNCPAMCDEWAKRDSRIKVIHQENAGLSAARNIGLDIATGDYIGFVDSDDYIHCKFYECLIKAFEEESIDISYCGMLFVYSQSSIDLTISGTMNIVVENRNSTMHRLIYVDGLDNHVMNKLYRRSILDGLKFESGRLHEDVIFQFQCIDRCKNVGKIDCDLYYYVQRQDSIVHTASLKSLLDSFEAHMFRSSMLMDKYADLNTALIVHNCINALPCWGYLVVHESCLSSQQKSVLVELENYIDENVVLVLDKWCVFGIKERMKVYLYRYMKELLVVLYKIRYNFSM